MTHQVVKRHKRLVIVNEAGEVVYTPPHFLLPVTSRTDFAPLLEVLNTIGRLGGEALTAFETRFNPRALGARLMEKIS